ncbi:hypothetical protein LCD36_04650 [Saccharopolyspora sp. 6T]|uniref:hypothetical protein n=1 Tax=Saccharopolyspora sp. 6T TaxID=2877238 RepID=UPI001CD45620|nr:hypothetical protein [Saccharopolyspora sp. 6T]MCA1185742.1 hypothetical protein [Saccharopolyspora sp. 6T]
MRTLNDWALLIRRLDAHAETAQHDLDARRYHDALCAAVDLSTYVGIAREWLLDEAFDRLTAAGLIPTREDMDVVAALTNRIKSEEIAA